jgi:thiol:disulfide interchange protein
MVSEIKMMNRLSAFALGLLVAGSSVVLSVSPACAKHHHKDDSAAAPAATESSGGLQWTHDLKQAKEDAKTAQKYVLVDVYTDWCRWCKELDKTTYQDSNVVQLLNKSFICVKLNAETEPQGRKARTEYNVEGFPWILVLNPDGSLRGKIGGYQEAGPFAQSLQQIIDGTATD